MPAAVGAWFRQSTSHGLVHQVVLPNTPMSDLLPEQPSLMFQMPSPPRIEHRQEVVGVQPRLHSVVCRPADKQCKLCSMER